MATKKAAPRKKAAKPMTLKRPTRNAIKEHFFYYTPAGRLKPRAMGPGNTGLKKAGYLPITESARDALFKSLRKTENNQISKPAGKRGPKPGTGAGGKRSGSGRKKGAATKRTREIADKLAESGEMTPLEYMLGVLRETPEKIKAQYDSGEIDAVEYAVKMTELIKRRDNAAEKAAPYIHPRLASIEAKVEDSGHEKWLALMEGLVEAS